MERRIETQYGMVRVAAYREDESHPTRKVLTVIVQDLHSSNGGADAAPVVVNGIPVHFTQWLRAELLSDLSQESSWRMVSGTVTRNDGNGYNDATTSQKSKVWRTVREVVTGLFADPNFLFEVVLDDQKSVVEQKRKAVEKARADFLAAEAELSAAETVAAEMEQMAAPSDGTDEDRRRAFRLDSK